MKNSDESTAKKCLRMFKRFWVDGSGLTIKAILFLSIIVLVLICLDYYRGYLKKKSYLTIEARLTKIEKRLDNLEGTKCLR
ncbi:hypothetical protein AGMMS50222_10500 [Endomicrobiia bacterium]|nr:hypothetical protein AGMMS49531_09040 [Endomicrobiia bacterium]GHT66750.1 hypothetical protein AGMMS49556_07960 [Endomicrobiia bacterium]GHT77120.1 hypothetical protein AGMMS50222_10500 [Endomicrobiia bacterium]